MFRGALRSTAMLTSDGAPSGVRMEAEIGSPHGRLEYYSWLIVMVWQKWELMNLPPEDLSNGMG